MRGVAEAATMAVLFAVAATAIVLVVAPVTAGCLTGLWEEGDVSGCEFGGWEKKKQNKGRKKEDVRRSS